MFNAYKQLEGDGKARAKALQKSHQTMTAGWLHRQKQGAPTLLENSTSVIDDKFITPLTGYFAIRKMRRILPNDRFSMRSRTSADFAKTPLLQPG